MGVFELGVIGYSVFELGGDRVQLCVSESA